MGAVQAVSLWHSKGETFLLLKRVLDRIHLSHSCISFFLFYSSHCCKIPWPQAPLSIPFYSFSLTPPSLYAQIKEPCFQQHSYLPGTTPSVIFNETIKTITAPSLPPTRLQEPKMTRLLLVLPIVLLCYLPTLTLACDRQCQREIPHVFADKYQVVSSHYFDHLRTQIGSILFQDLPLDTITVTRAQSQKAIQIMQDSVTRAQNTWDVDLSRKAFEAIFKDEPNFVGDCVENIPPERVLPKFTTPNNNGAGSRGGEGGGSLWTIKDCHETNYICGKPPSICHFLPLIKKRISTKVKAGLRSKLDTGDDTDLYVNYLGPALQRILDEYEGLMPFKAALHGTLNLIMVGCLKEIDRLGVGEADINWVEGSTLWKKEWDQEIREKVLTYT